MLLGGFSKSHAMTGWRIGYVAAPAELLAAMRKIHQYIIMSAPTTAQEAAIEALKTRRAVCRGDARRNTTAAAALIVDGFNSLGLRLLRAARRVLRLPLIASTGLSDADFSERLLTEEHVAMVPGSAFGESGRGFVRA